MRELFQKVRTLLVLAHDHMLKDTLDRLASKDIARQYADSDWVKV